MLETVGTTRFEAHCVSIVFGCFGGYITFLRLIRDRQKSLCRINGLKLHASLHY